MTDSITQNRLSFIFGWSHTQNDHCNQSVAVIPSYSVHDQRGAVSDQSGQYKWLVHWHDRKLASHWRRVCG